MECYFKGKPYFDEKKQKARKPVCKKYGFKCRGEDNCEYLKKVAKDLQKQLRGK